MDAKIKARAKSLLGDVYEDVLAIFGDGANESKSATAAPQTVAPEGIHEVVEKQDRVTCKAQKVNGNGRCTRKATHNGYCSIAAHQAQAKTAKNREKRQRRRNNAPKSYSARRNGWQGDLREFTAGTFNGRIHNTGSTIELPSGVSVGSTRKEVNRLASLSSAYALNKVRDGGAAVRDGKFTSHGANYALHVNSDGRVVIEYLA